MQTYFDSKKAVEGTKSLIIYCNQRSIEEHIPILKKFCVWDFRTTIFLNH